MTSIERSFLEERLTTSELLLVVLLAPLHDEQWTFREATERWSIAENLEHLVLFERFIRNVVVEMLTEPASSGTLATATDSQVLALREVGDTSLQSRDVAIPKSTLGNPEKLLRDFQSERAKTISYASTVEGDLRGHYFKHLVLGELDAYQWLLVIAQHTERHITQMKNVMAHSDFPG